MSVGPAGEPAAPATVELPVERWTPAGTVRTTDQVAQEEPVALIYHDVPHVVMLATPADLTDYAYGFTVSEALVARADEIREVRVARDATGAEVRIAVAWERFTQLLQRRRNLTGRTGCGLCGAESVADAIRELPPLTGGPRVGTGALHEMLEALRARQPINALTGSVHAAAWVVPGEGIVFVREDVGRHNALDKAIGAMLRVGRDPQQGYMLVTSRASYEMVQKCATVGITLLVALSAPTAFAVRIAGQVGMTLVAFARREQHVVYSHPWRLA